MKDDELGQIQQEYIKLKNIIGCKRYDSDLFFDKVKQKKLFTNKLHKNVPFIIKEDKEYINYDSLSIILSKDIIDKINVKEFVKDSFIPNYRLMFPSELDQIYLDDFID
jgi:hypothetical protein